ncbi:MAG TPA: hypothetical protein VFH03_19515 [Actinoplanes sp.]|nr:hypothetical protein [Actinoplanes sp.]
MTDEPFDSEVPVAPRDRREPGGMPLRPRTEDNPFPPTRYREE